MAETKTYTPQGFKALQDELEYLETVRVEENKKEISTARSFGDLSENSEYDEAKNEQAKVEGRINELEEMLKNVEVVDVADSADTAGFGSTVTVIDEDGEEEVYTIVGAAEANFLQGKISNESPIGAALFGKAAGATVEFETPMGTSKLTIKEVTHNK
jgi:transcription elongation factor GreA